MGGEIFHPPIYNYAESRLKKIAKNRATRSLASQNYSFSSLFSLFLVLHFFCFNFHGDSPLTHLGILETSHILKGFFAYVIKSVPDT